jgi:serine/threonine protein kinase
VGSLDGQIIRGYEFLKPIGSGGYGMVYEALEQAVNRPVAIKVILPDYANQPEFIANFEQEARLVAQLEHPTIVPLYTYWQDDQGAFLVMRYIKGGSLRDMLKKQGALPLSQTTRILTQVAEALQVAHEFGVVHRDLKPDNILIDERGNAYLTDFGIAKHIDGNKSAPDAIKGTFAYLSPEQIQAEAVSAQTDIYAFGIMLYELLAGKHPFQDAPIGVMIVKHLHENLPSLRPLRPDLPEDIDNIIQKATHKDPQQRHTSVLELSQALNTSVMAQPQNIISPLSAKPIATSPEQRNRASMLQNVRKFWIEGVLENSLHGANLLSLGMQLDSKAVDNLWNTILRTPHGETTLASDTDISHVFDRMNGKLLILGDPGSGKTTTLLELTRHLLDRAMLDTVHPIPVIFNLSSWGEKQQPLTDWLIDELGSKYQVPKKVAQTWVEGDDLLLLLDGLDEVIAMQRDGCVQAINTYRAEHGFVDMVVSSRITDYEALANRLKLNGAIVIQPLNAEQIDRYMNSFGTELATIQRMVTEDNTLRELARSPLMLNIMALAYRAVSEAEVKHLYSPEAQRQHIFAVYVQRMFERRMGEMRYPPEQVVHYLAWLAHQMQAHAQSVFQIEKLQPTWLNKQQWQGYYWGYIALAIMTEAGIFALAWYLTASIFGIPSELLGLTILLSQSLVVWALATDRMLNRGWLLLTSVAFGMSVGLPIALSKGLPSGIIAGTFFMFVAGGQNYFADLNNKRINSTLNSIILTEKLRLSITAINPRAGIGGFLLGMIPLLVFLPLLGVEAPLPRLLLAIGISGAITAVSLLVQSGLITQDIEQRIVPNQGVWNSARSAFLIGLMVGIANFIANTLAFLLVTVPEFAIRIGLGTCLALFIFTSQQFGLSALLQHFSLRQALHRDGAIPQNYARFLDYTTDLIFLRKVGGGYIFVHRYLLEYFAELDNKDSSNTQ